MTEDQQLIAQLEQKILKRKAQLNEIEQSLPRKNSLYLKVSFVLIFIKIYNIRRILLKLKEKLSKAFVVMLKN